jgi:hypothetical protein
MGPKPPTPVRPSRDVELIVGVLGIIVGLVGIYAAAATNPAALDALGDAVSGSGLPYEFRGFAGNLTVFTVMLGIVLCLAAIAVGCLALFSFVFRSLGAAKHLRYAFVFVLFLISCAITATTALVAGQDAASGIGVLCFMAVSVLAGMVIPD